MFQVKLLLPGKHALCMSCHQYVTVILLLFEDHEDHFWLILLAVYRVMYLLPRDHASCESSQHYVMQCVCCLETMLCGCLAM